MAFKFNNISNLPLSYNFCFSLSTKSEDRYYPGVNPHILPFKKPRLKML
jgi:hypothetical protein